MISSDNLVGQSERRRGAPAYRQEPLESQKRLESTQAPRIARASYSPLPARERGKGGCRSYSAHLQAHNPVHLLGTGGEHEDWHVRLAAQDATYLETVQAGEHQVQHDQVWRLFPGNVQGRQAVGSGDDFVALAGQVVFQGFQQRQVIFDDQDRALLFAPFFSFSWP